MKREKEREREREDPNYPGTCLSYYSLPSSILCYATDFRIKKCFASYGHKNAEGTDREENIHWHEGRDWHTP